MKWYYYVFECIKLYAVAIGCFIAKSNKNEK